MNMLIDGPQHRDSVTFGTSFLPGTSIGVDLAEHGYVEEEYFVSGTADEWAYDALWHARVRTAAVEYATRVLIRRPADATHFSGAVQLEPLHPDLDNAATWRAVHPWILRNGHAWVGVTQNAAVAADIRDRFPERYAGLSIPIAGLGYDIVGDVAVAVREGRFRLPPVTRLMMSGWSITGSFCRVFLQDGFHDRHRLSDGSPAVSGYALCISSGPFLRGGYPALSEHSPLLPQHDPRRTIRRAPIPVFEILSENESETHPPALRPDSDAPDDRYRLFQVAGTSHVQLNDETPLTNTEQYARRGGELRDTRIAELPSDGRLDYVARALFEQLDGWVAGRTIPPRADRFAYSPTDESNDVTPLARDRLGNAIGGIRPPWIDVPLASYSPHSTPAPGALHPVKRFPASGTPEQSAAMIAHMTPLPPDALRARYDSLEDYLDQFRRSAERCVLGGVLLREEADALISRAEKADLRAILK